MNSIANKTTERKELTGSTCKSVCQKMQWLGKHNYKAPKFIKGQWIAYPRIAE